MANVTLSIPDDLLRRARLRAAREGTSVNRVPLAELAHYVDEDAEVGQAWDEFLALAQDRSGRSPEGRRTWRRADLQRADLQRPPSRR